MDDVPGVFRNIQHSHHSGFQAFFSISSLLLINLCYFSVTHRGFDSQKLATCTPHSHGAIQRITQNLPLSHCLPDQLLKKLLSSWIIRPFMSFLCLFLTFSVFAWRVLCPYFVFMHTVLEIFLSSLKSAPFFLRCAHIYL